MKLDLEAALRKSNAGAGPVRVQWTGLKSIEIDEQAFAEAVVEIVAHAMGQNLFRGLRPDGAGPMPGREKDGRPRGMGALIALRLTGRRIDQSTWEIGPDHETPGHLARIMQEVPFRAPPFQYLETPIHLAFVKATMVRR